MRCRNPVSQTKRTISHSQALWSNVLSCCWPWGCVCVCVGFLPFSSRARGHTLLFVLCHSLLNVTQPLLAVSVKVMEVIVLRFRLGLCVDVKHVLALLHLLQELVCGLEDRRTSDRGLTGIRLYLQLIQPCGKDPRQKMFGPNRIRHMIIRRSLEKTPLKNCSRTCSGFQLVKEKSCSDGQMGPFF